MTKLNPYISLDAKAESLPNDSALLVSNIINFLKTRNQQALRYSIIWALAERLSNDDLMEVHYNVAGLNTEYIHLKHSGEVKRFYAFQRTDKAISFAELLSDSLSELYSEDNEKAVSLALETILYKSDILKQKDKKVAPLSFNLLTVPEELALGYRNFGKQLHYYYALPTLYNKMYEADSADSKIEITIQFESAIYILLTSTELLKDVLLGMDFNLVDKHGNDLLKDLQELSESQSSYLNQMLFEVFCSNPIDSYTTDLSLIQLIALHSKGTPDVKGYFQLNYVGKDNFINSTLESNIMLNFDFPETLDYDSRNGVSLEHRLAYFIRKHISDVHRFSFSFPMLDRSNFNIRNGLMTSEARKIYTSPVFTQVSDDQTPKFFEFIMDVYRMRIALLTDATYLATTLERAYDMQNPIMDWEDKPFSKSDLYNLTDSVVEEEPPRNRDSKEWRHKKIKEVTGRITDLNNLMDYKLDALSDVYMEAGVSLPEDTIEATSTFIKRRIYYGLF